MAGYSSAGVGAEIFVKRKLEQRKVVLFVKKTCGECRAAEKLLSIYNLSGEDYEVCEISNRQDCTQIENWFHFHCLLDTRTVPRLFVLKRHIGGIKEMRELKEEGILDKLIERVMTPS